jgi:hypothetical protein
MLGQSPPEVLDWIDKGGVVAVLVLGLFGVIVGAMRGWWIPGRTHDRVVAERDRLFELALASTVTAETSAKVMERQQRVAEEVAVRAALAALERGTG